MMFNEILRNLRKLSKKDIRQVSCETQINYYNLARYERGDCEPNIETLIILSKYYGVSIDYLLTGNSSGIYISSEEYQKLKSAKESFDTIASCLNDVVHRQDLLMNKGN